MRFRRRESERQFIMHAAHCVGDDLVFVDDKQPRAFAAQKTGALGFQRRNENPRIQIQREIARGDADIPATRSPFREFVVRQRARGHGKNRLPFERRVEQLENVGLARAGRRLHDHILAGSQVRAPHPVARDRERKD